MTTVGMLLALLLSLPQDAEFAEILKGFDADEPALRESASRKLDALVLKLGPGAEAFLKSKIADAKGEVKGRLEEKLLELSRIEKLRKKLAFFDAFGLPSCRDKRLVILNTGETGWSQTPDNLHFSYELGWLIAETPDEVTLMGSGLESVPFKRNRSTLKDWERVRDKQPKEYPAPGEFREVELPQICRDLMDATTTDATQGVGFFHRSGNAWRLDPALFAHWCLQRDLEKTAFQLVELGEAAWRDQVKNDPRPYSEELVQRACAVLRYQAVGGSARVLSRTDMLRKWETIEQLSPQFREGESGKMIPLYEQMIREDKAWKAPTPGELAAMAPADRVNHWIHLLRDVAARQWSDPGSCRILGPFSESKDGSPYPPSELVALGWEALPAIIEHLDDARPTRSLGWHRSFNPASYYLLRVGDCCEQIFHAITGYSIYQARSTSSAMVKDGDAPTSKAKALKWWAEKQKGGAEKYFIEALDTPEFAATAAEKLLSTDKAKHLPRLLSILEKGPSGSRKAILRPLGPFLEKDHRKLLEGVLSDPDPEAVAEAAPILWDRFGSDRGGVALIERLKAVLPEDKDSTLVWRSSHLLRPMRTEPVARGLADLMKSGHVGLRRDANQTASMFPHPLLAKALAAQLDDKTPTGWSSSFPIRYCDDAACALSLMTGVRDRFDLKGSDEERDATIAGLKAWWEKEGAALDWKALLRKAEESERPRPDPKK